MAETGPQDKMSRYERASIRRGIDTDKSVVITALVFDNDQMNNYIRFAQTTPDSREANATKKYLERRVKELGITEKYGRFHMLEAMINAVGTELAGRHPDDPRLDCFRDFEPEIEEY